MSISMAMYPTKTREILTRDGRPLTSLMVNKLLRIEKGTPYREPDT